MLASRVVCPRAVPQRRTECLSAAARARLAPRGVVAEQGVSFDYAQVLGPTQRAIHPRIE
eukprot:3279215-Prymnesium_polylepis.1